MIRVDRLADRQDRLFERHKEAFAGHAKRKVLVEGDSAFLLSRPGQIAWALALNLLARLYKGIDEFRLVIDPTIVRSPNVMIPNSETNLREASLRLLADLNPNYYRIAEGWPENLDEWVVVRIGGLTRRDGRTVSIGAQGWRAFVNDDRWRNVAQDNNPFGALLAACLGVAAVYRLLYPLRNETPLEGIVLSAYDHSSGIDGPNPQLPPLDIPKTYIAGAGAIGMAFLFALGCIGAVRSSGGLHVVDYDPLDDTNLNRCLLAILSDFESLKVDIVSRSLKGSGIGLKTYPETWQTFVDRPEHRDAANFEWVVSCVDKYDGRRAVQYDRLPRILLTAGTNDFLVSVSRHALNDGMACGLCHQARAPVGCATASDATAAAFVEEPDPSIGFVSALAGILLCAEYVKAIAPSLVGGAVANAVRVNPLVFKARRHVKAKDPECGCTSKYVALGYESTWPSMRRTK